MIRNSCSPVRIESCVDQDRTTREVYLNASNLYINKRSLNVILSTDLTGPHHTEQSISLSIPTLIDSGSTDCFIDSRFVSVNSISTIPINPIKLRLFDGSVASAPISESVFLHIRFPSGKSFH